MSESRSHTALIIRALILLVICVAIRAASVWITDEELGDWGGIQTISGAVWDFIPIYLLLVLSLLIRPLAGASILVCMLLFFQSLVFGYILFFGQAPNLYELSLLPQILVDLPTLIDPVKPLSLFLVVVASCLIYGRISKAIAKWKIIDRRPTMFIGLAVLITTVAAISVLNLVALNQNHETRKIHDGSPLVYFINSSFGQRQRAQLTEDDHGAQIEFYDPSHYSFSEGVPRRRNTARHVDAVPKKSRVVFVLLESFSKWPFWRSFEGRQFGADLFSEFRNVISFENTYSVWDHTLESIESLFYSLPPTVNMINKAPSEVDKSLFNYLAKDGYQIVTASAYPDNFYSTKNALTCFVQPHHFYSQEQLIEIAGASVEDKVYLSDETLYSAAYQLVLTHFKHSKDFMFLVNAATHPPYKQQRVLESGQAIFTQPRTSWQKQINVLDYALGQLTRFMKKVHSTPGLEQTVFVITSDHIPPGAWRFGEGVVGHNEFFRLFKIPFFIILPEDADTGMTTVNQLSTQLDITPTLLDFLEIDEKDSRFIGQSLLRDNDTSNRYISTRFWDAIGSRIRYGDELFDLDDLGVIKSQLSADNSVTERFTRFGRAYQSHVRRAPEHSDERLISRDNWSLLHVDSFQENNPATSAFDGDGDTIWHSRWYPRPDPQPHEMVIDLGATYNIDGFRYLPRSDGSNGTVGNFELYIGESEQDLVEPVLKQKFCGQSEKQVLFRSRRGRFIKFRTLSEINDQPFSSAAEIDFLGHRHD